MSAGTPRSDQSGEVLNAGAPAHVIYVFEDGHRRLATLTVAEAAHLRGQGTDRTTTLSRLNAWITWHSLAKWLAAALVGAVIAGYISDQYSDKQSEVTLEGTLVQDVSAASIALYQQAQEARATDTAHRRAARDKAADAWVLASGTLTPTFKVYYPKGSRVVRNWDAYQGAMYNWAVLGCCTTSTGRQKLVDSIHTYIDAYVGPPTRSAPVADPWKALATTGRPHHDLYQWVGLYLLRGRGSIMNDLRSASASLD
ncbi:MAG: hypothetical protein HOQ45_12905 [Nocardioidaceae bacterium]|nr:hypothetical protein [Nocardioidaceae bacterium]